MIDFHTIAQESLAHQDKWELEAMLKVVSSFQPKRILSIGTHSGNDLRTFREAFAPELLLGIELTTEFSYPDLPHILVSADSHQFETAVWVEQKLGSHLLDFLFIDADHHYKDVALDFYMYKDFVKKGGIIALHDIAIRGNDSCEVYQFWEHIKDRYPSQGILNPSGEGTGTGLLFV